jgi:hypothetical protein
MLPAAIEGLEDVPVEREMIAKPVGKIVPVREEPGDCRRAA